MFWPKTNLQTAGDRVSTMSEGHLIFERSYSAPTVPSPMVPSPLRYGTNRTEVEKIGVNVVARFRPLNEDEKVA